jgi:hypothetical protein
MNLVNKLNNSSERCSLDGHLSDMDNKKDAIKHQNEQQNSRNSKVMESESGDAGVKKNVKNFKTITSRKTSQVKDDGSTESFIPFSQRTSITHAPTIYEELIQKYEGDIRNHIRIEQQMKLHSDSVLNKLEDKERQYDKIIDKIKKSERIHKDEMVRLKAEFKIVKEENNALKKALEK